MASDDVVVRIRFDTKEAERDLDRAGQRAERSGAGAGGGLLRRFRGAAGFLGAAGLVAGAGATVGRSTIGGVGDILTARLSRLSAQLEAFLLQGEGAAARGTNRAVEETVQAFGPIAGALGRLPPGTREFFQAVEARAQQEERGALLVRTAVGPPAAEEAVEGAKAGAAAGAAAAGGPLGAAIVSLGEKILRAVEKLGGNR